MIIMECPQGSPEWHRERAGAITASMFAECRRVVDGLTAQQQVYVNAILAGETEDEAKRIASYKSKPTSTGITRALAGEKVGDFSEAAKNYAFRLAIERISGEPLADEQFDTFAMRRGRELEPEARDVHAFETGLDIIPTGLVLTDDRKFGASADGLINHDGGAEYKCLISPEKIRAILLSGDISEFTDQVQGGMWLTGRTWWHFCLYCPALASVGRALTVFRVDRNEEYIEALESDLMRFDALVESYRADLIDPPRWAL